MPSRARSLVIVVVYALLLIVTAWLLEQLAQRKFTAHLRDQAAHALALAVTGDTPYHWQLQNADDIVAGRVFGADDSHFDDDELVVRSSGAAFEVGLPLTRGIDLRRFPHLHISIAVDAPAELQVVVRQKLDAPELISAGIALGSGKNSVALDLSALNWTSGALVVAPPDSAAMLRLRFAVPEGEQLRLRAIALDRIDGAQRIDLNVPPRVVDPGISAADGTPVLRLPFRQQTQKMDIAQLSANADVRKPLLILLPQHGRVEQQIALRNAVFTSLPGALLLPESALDASFTRAYAQSVGARSDLPELLPWFAFVVYALLLCLSRLRPSRSLRIQALTEIVLVLAAPLWLIIDGRFDGNPDAPQKALIGLSVLYAVSLSIPKRWRWNGSMRAWILAGAVVAIAALLGFLVHQPGESSRAIGPGHVARYLAWALLQQYLICAVCTERWHIVAGNAAIAAYLGALGFALMHTPNAALMLATLLGGLCWCALYLRERALLPLAVSHAASALLLLALLPADILASAEVSARFFQ